MSQASAARSPLLERTEELGRIASALADARAGRGTFLVVEGPAGIGKTALLQAARVEAAAADMRVLRARGTELEREFAFGVVRQLFEPPLAEVSEQERADLLHTSAVGAAALFTPEAVVAEDARPSGTDPSFAILHGLYWLCTNLAAASPLFLVVDDAHLADAPSLRFLSFLLTRLEDLDLALILATRPREPGTDTGVLATITTDPSAEVIRLPPLTSSAVAAFVESTLGAPPEPPFADACVRATRGTPFLLQQLLEALREEKISPTADRATDVERIGAVTVGRSIRLRLGRLPEHAGRLAHGLAILERGDLSTAARLADLGVDESAEAAQLLTTAGIVESGLPLTFVHPIVRSGIYSELTGAQRAYGHRRAARLLAEQPAASQHVAEHLLASEPAGEAWAVDQLVAAAQASARQGAPESAAVFLRRALAEPPPVDVRPELLLDLGVAEASAGLDCWNEHLREAVDAAPTPTAAAECARLLARALNRAQRFAEAVEVLDHAAAALGPDESDLALQLEASSVIVGMNDVVVSPATALRRKELMEKARGRAASSEVLAAGALVSVLSNEPAETVAGLALLAEERAAYGSAQEQAIASIGLPARRLSLVWAERYAEVLPLLNALVTRASAIGDGGLLAIGLASRGWLALRQGDLGAAEADTRTALAATELPAPPMYRLLNGALLVETLIERGDLDAAEDVLGPLAAEAERPSLVAAIFRFVRGRLRVEAGRVQDGLDELLAAGALLGQAHVSCPSCLPWRSEAALAHLALGAADSAATLAEEELELARTFGAPRALGVAQRAAGLVAGDVHGEGSLRAAVASFELAGARLERARALTDLGAMLRRRNRRAEARELLRDALDVAHRVGAGRLADRAETELRATGARPRRILLSGVESLTASERRIAELAAQGLTNREIAQMLFVTTRTVEGHLTSIFRKLRLESRNELRDALGARAPVPV